REGDHDGEGVRDDVVHLARDARALGGGGELGLLVAVARDRVRALDEVGHVLAPRAHVGADRERHEAQDRRDEDADHAVDGRAARLDALPQDLAVVRGDDVVPQEGRAGQGEHDDREDGPRDARRSRRGDGVDGEHRRDLEAGGVPRDGDRDDADRGEAERDRHGAPTTPVEQRAASEEEQEPEARRAPRLLRGQRVQDAGDDEDRDDDPVHDDGVPREVPADGTEPPRVELGERLGRGPHRQGGRGARSGARARRRRRRASGLLVRRRRGGGPGGHASRRLSTTAAAAVSAAVQATSTAKPCHGPIASGEDIPPPSTICSPADAGREFMSVWTQSAPVTPWTMPRTIDRTKNTATSVKIAPAELRRRTPTATENSATAVRYSTAPSRARWSSADEKSAVRPSPDRMG